MTILAFLAAILVLVSLHELGHFIAARCFNIKVERFSVGFGKPFFTRVHKGVEWCLAPIPLGGYVKMADTREGEVAPEDLPYAFDKQAPWKRIIVVAAGPVTNLLLAVLLMACGMLYGINEFKPVIGTVLPDSVAARAGFAEGDEILAINGQPVKDFGEMQTRLLLETDRRPAVVTVEDGSGAHQVRVIDPAQEKAALTAIARGKADFGMLPVRYVNRLGMVVAGSPAEKAGLKTGDVITAIDGVAIESWFDVTRIIRDSPGRLLDITYERGGQVFQAALRPNSVETAADKPLIGKAGFAAGTDEQWDKTVRQTLYPDFFAALGMSAQKNWDYAVITLKFFGRLITGQASVTHISGPVTIADMAGQTAKMGLQSYLMFLALISLSLGVLNLMPVPVLDGGHLLYYAVEWIRGKPLSLRVQEYGVRFGMALLLLLMCVALFNDFARLMG